VRVPNAGRLPTRNSCFCWRLRLDNRQSSRENYLWRVFKNACMRGRPTDLTRIAPPIVRVLTRYPDGLTLRELSRQSGVPLSTIRYQLPEGSAVTSTTLQSVPNATPLRG